MEYKLKDVIVWRGKKYGWEKLPYVEYERHDDNKGVDFYRNMRMHPTESYSCVLPYKEWMQEYLGSTNDLRDDIRFKSNNMEKVIINGKEYQIDIDKCKEQGLLVEKEKWYPNNWEELHGDRRITDKFYGVSDIAYKCVFAVEEERDAFVALGQLIQLRDWWWDNMCDGWRPDWTDYAERKYNIYGYSSKIATYTCEENHNILAFPSEEIRNKFFEAYKDLIKEAKMFL